MAAARGGSVEANAFILANGGCISDTNRSGWTVMMAAAEGGSVEAMKFILANGGSMKGVLCHCKCDEATKFCLLCGGD